MCSWHTYSSTELQEDLSTTRNLATFAVILHSVDYAGVDEDCEDFRESADGVLPCHVDRDEFHW
jgi:hypothetical protein